MTDVSKIHGPSGPAGDSGKKEKSSADMDKFKDEMRKRVDEVGKIDPDEKKKRKQREEEEDDLAAPQPTPTPPDQVTPFSLEKGTQKISPADMQKGGPGVSPLKSAQPTPPGLKSSFYQAPSSEELSDDAGMLEEESFRTPPSYGSSAPRPNSWQPEGQKPVAPGPPESNQNYPEQDLLNNPLLVLPKAGKKKLQGYRKKLSLRLNTKNLKGTRRIL